MLLSCLQMVSGLPCSLCWLWAHTVPLLKKVNWSLFSLTIAWFEFTSTSDQILSCSGFSSPGSHGGSHTNEAPGFRPNYGASSSSYAPGDVSYNAPSKLVSRPAYQPVPQPEPQPAVLREPAAPVESAFVSGPVESGHGSGAVRKRPVGSVAPGAAYQPGSRGNRSNLKCSGQQLKETVDNTCRQLGLQCGFAKSFNCKVKSCDPVSFRNWMGCCTSKYLQWGSASCFWLRQSTSSSSPTTWTWTYVPGRRAGPLWAHFWVRWLWEGDGGDGLPATSATTPSTACTQRSWTKLHQRATTYASSNASSRLGFLSLLRLHVPDRPVSSWYGHSCQQQLWTREGPLARCPLCARPLPTKPWTCTRAWAHQSSLCTPSRLRSTTASCPSLWRSWSSWFTLVFPWSLCTATCQACGLQQSQGKLA